MSNKIEVLVVTMHQDGFTIVKKMNLKTDAIIANQSDKYHYQESRINEKANCRLITTSTRGVGVNRNIALLAARGDILVFADDDNIYYDDYEKKIKDAFEELEDADVIIFGVRILKDKKVIKNDVLKTSKARLWNTLRFGMYRIAIRKKSLLAKNIHFSHIFGGGTIYSAGEDSLFIRECFKKSLNVYTHSSIICDNYKDSSTWFKGYTEKYFFDKGAVLAALFPTFKYFLIFYYAMKFREKGKISFKKKLTLMLKGCSTFQNLQEYRNEYE